MSSTKVTQLKPQDEVPYEILREIFLLTLPKRDCDRIHPSYSPTIVSQVCSRWREIAFSEPRLWDTVMFSTSRNFKFKIGGNQRDRFIQSGNIQRWFHRTGGSHTLVLGEEASDKAETCLISQLFPIIVEFSARLRTLKIAMTSASHLDYLRELSQVPQFGELVKVGIHASVRASMTSNDVKTLRMIDAFKGTKTPKLNEAHFMLDMASPGKFAMPWNQLRVVRLKGCPTRQVSPLDWMQLLVNCPNLETAELIKPFDPDESWASWPERIPQISLSDAPKYVRDELPLVSLTIHDADSYLHNHQVTGSPECMFIHRANFACLKHLTIRLPPWPMQAEQPERWLVQALSGLKKLESLTLYTGAQFRSNSPYPYRFRAIVQNWAAAAPPPGGFGALRSFTLQYAHNHAMDLVQLLQGPLSTTHCPSLSMTIAGEDKEMNTWRALLGDPAFSGVAGRLKVTPRSKFNFQ
ncbi:hypothetical protein D9611_006979 [Ephemerocybe angulata]|uniref:F-box domain-containing protein n=1 Tax=Ephemerocybe angulata TaxID=980116 RepID=A0A8H5EVE5_9AGAR|nr:hypothetical protein D9611_006979 [Tulosesus angulatus]